MTPTRFCRTYGINGTVMRHARLYGLNDRHADHWAIRAGYHPAQVWGPEWFTAAETAVQVSPGRSSAPTGHPTGRRRSTGHTAPRTPVPTVPDGLGMAV